MAAFTHFRSVIKKPVNIYNGLRQATVMGNQLNLPLFSSCAFRVNDVNTSWFSERGFREIRPCPERNTFISGSSSQCHPRTKYHTMVRDGGSLLKLNQSLPSSTHPLISANFYKDSGKHITEQYMLTPQRIVEALPAYLQPYLRLMRFDRPIGTWLLFLPCTWSISLAAAPQTLPDLYMLSLFGLGALLMRGAGCTINDMWDRDFDKRVARTKDRPLASGRLSQFQALTFLGFQLSASLGILLTLNYNTILLGVCSMVPVVVYPLMKRVTFWPQVFLGVTFNWGAVMGWSAITGNCAWEVVLPLYAACISWTMVYDTIYAHQDKDDDILVGVKSTALRFGDETKKWIAGFSSITIAGLALTGAMCDQTWPYYLGVGLFASHLGKQIFTVDLNNPDDCGKKFRSNKNIGLIFLGAIIAGNFLKKRDTIDESDANENQS